jgi:hypothetical protein
LEIDDLLVWLQLRQQVIHDLIANFEVAGDDGQTGQ